MGKHVVKILITQVLSNVIYTLFVVMGKRASDFWKEPVLQEKHINYVRCGLLFPCADLKNGMYMYGKEYIYLWLILLLLGL